jgi:hypothetical protein
VRPLKVCHYMYVFKRKQGDVTGTGCVPVFVEDRRRTDMTDTWAVRGAFATLRKVGIGSVMSDCPRGITVSHWTDFHKI